MVLRNGNIWFNSVCKPIAAVIIRVTQPLVKQIEAQPLELPDNDDGKWKKMVVQPKGE